MHEQGSHKDRRQQTVNMSWFLKAQLIAFDNLICEPQKCQP